MSKKKSTQTETEAATTLTVIPAVTADLGVKSEDLIAVAVARRERALTAALHRANREMRDLAAQDEKSRVNRDKALKAATEEAVGGRVEALKAALTALTGRVEVKVVPAVRDRDGALYASVTLAEKGNHYSIQVGVEVPQTEDVLAAEEEIVKMASLLKAKMEEIYALKGEINNIASTERQARAALAEATLRGTATGRELLEAMTSMAGLMEVPQIGLTLNSEEK